MDKDKFMNQKAKDMNVSELANAIKIKTKNMITDYETSKPKEEWKDITKECHFIPQPYYRGNYYLKIKHKGEQIGFTGYVNSTDSKIMTSTYVNYKIDINDNRDFKIFKKVEVN